MEIFGNASVAAEFRRQVFARRSAADGPAELSRAFRLRRDDRVTTALARHPDKEFAAALDHDLHPVCLAALSARAGAAQDWRVDDGGADRHGLAKPGQFT